VRLSFSCLVAETLGCNDSNLIADSLVGLEVESQLWVVSLNDDLGGLLNGLSTNATHDCGVMEVGRIVESWRCFYKLKCSRIFWN
jgi:hypothetical protein